MSNGSQPRQTPARPSRCSQHPVTRNGGSARAITATARNQRRRRGSSPARNSAVKKPITVASSVVSALTSRLFLSSAQFISRISLLTIGRPIQTSQQLVPVRFQRRLRLAWRRKALECLSRRQLFDHFGPLQIL